MVSVIAPVPVFSEILNPVPAVSVTAVEPDVLEIIVDVVPEPAPTDKLPSLLTLPSTSVDVIVKLG